MFGVNVPKRVLNRRLDCFSILSNLDPNPAHSYLAA